MPTYEVRVPGGLFWELWMCEYDTYDSERCDYGHGLVAAALAATKARQGQRYMNLSLDRQGYEYLRDVSLPHTLSLLRNSASQGQPWDGMTVAAGERILQRLRSVSELTRTERIQV